MRITVTAAATLLLSGCSLAPEAPVVAPAGPTAPATAVPQATESPARAIAERYDNAAGRIENLLAESDQAPLTTVTGTVPGTEDEFVLDIVRVQTTETSTVVHMQLGPADGENLDLSQVDGGLSGELGDGNRSVGDLALVDEAAETRILPTVYRPDVGEEDPGQRCMCSFLPAVVPAQGVRLTAHYVMPEEGFTSVQLEVPGAGLSAAIGID